MIDIRFGLILVQPGLSKAAVLAEDDFPPILAAVSDFTLTRCESFTVWGSP